MSRYSPKHTASCCIKDVETDYRTFKQYSSGQYLSWLNNDIITISQKGITQFFNLIRGIAGITFSAIALIHYHWMLLVTTIVGFVCMVYIPKIFEKKMYQVSEQVTQSNEQFVEKLEDQLEGYPIYFAYGILPQFVHKIKQASLALKEIMMKEVKVEAALIATNFSVNVIFQILLTTIAAISYLNGWVVVGAVAAVGSLADIIFSGLGSVSHQIASIKSVKPILDKYNQLQEEVVKQTDASGGLLYEATDVHLKYKDVTIFKQKSFQIAYQDKCLIAGLSGSGKSSLVQLLLGYQVDFDGEIKYKGHNIKHISSKKIAEEVLYLAQQTHIFKGSVKENILLGDTFSDECILSYLNLVGFTQPELIIDSDASLLSGGQKQRVALARALIRQPNVIICDEITSSLDKESAAMIENIILSNKSLTVIMITHTLYSDKNLFNKIIEL